jgi:hypothetical protein
VLLGGKANQPMKVCPEDARLTRRWSSIPLVIANGRYRQFDFVITSPPLKGSCRQMTINVQDFAHLGIFGWQQEYSSSSRHVL